LDIARLSIQDRETIPRAASALSTGELRGTALTTLITASFAAFWGLGGSVAIPGPARIVLIILVLLITALLYGSAFAFVRAARHRPATDAGAADPFRTRVYRFAVIAQLVAIPSSVGCSWSAAILTPSYPRSP